jgi:hypothetical protein
MGKGHMARSSLAISAWLLSVTLSAQGERITVRMAPTPNQTLHVRTTQETVTEAQSPAGDSPFPAVTMSMVIESTSTVGAADRDGSYTAKMTVDRMSVTGAMNGKPMTLPAMFDETLRPVITWSYDRDGKVLDVAADGLPAASADGIKQFMARAMGSMAPITLAVGESVTVPAALSLPIGSPSAPIEMSAETRYTLTSVTFDGAERIAHLTTRMTTTISRRTDAPADSPPALDLTVTGDGKSDVNIDRGIVVHMEQHLAMEGSVRADQAAVPSGTGIHGTISIVTDVVK